MIGRIITFKEKEGYGFIKSSNIHYFFHKSNVKYDSPKKGDIVKFEYRNNKKTKKTYAVKIEGINSNNLKEKYKLDSVINSNEILKSIQNNWKLEAKFETNHNYFFYNNELNSILNGNKYYIVGRKGTGKTSLSEHLLNINSFDVFSEKLNFKNFPFNELYGLTNNQYTPPNQYITIWKYLIFSTVAKLMVGNEKIDAEVRNLLGKLYKPDPIKSLKRTIDKWTTTSIELSGLGIGANINFDKKDIDKNVSWLQRVNDLEDIILQYCDNSTYYIIFDELDEDYRFIESSDRDRYINLLTSLYKAVQDIISSVGYKVKIKPVIFLRDDIYELINDSDKTKWEDLHIRIEWDINKIKAMLAHRISIDANLSFDLDFEEAWGLIFKDESVKTTKRYIETFEYITRSTHLRPRDYIRYLQACADESIIKNRNFIKGDTVKYVDRAFSNYLRNEIIDEIFPILPDIKIIFQIISNLRKANFSYEEFKNEYIKYSENGTIKEKNYDYVLERLYNFSVIGNQHYSIKETKFFKYLHSNITFNRNEKIVLHRGLFKALQI